MSLVLCLFSSMYGIDFLLLLLFFIYFILFYFFINRAISLHRSLVWFDRLDWSPFDAWLWKYATLKEHFSSIKAGIIALLKICQTFFFLQYLSLCLWSFKWSLFPLVHLYYCKSHLLILLCINLYVIHVADNKALQ